MLRSRIFLYRSIGWGVGICMVAFAPLFPQDAWDPFWLRAVISTIFLSVMISSYFVPAFVRKGDLVAQTLLYLVTSWIIFINVQNGMRVEYVFGFYINQFVSVLIFSRALPLLIYGGFNLLMGILTVFVVKDPQFPPPLFLALLLFLTSTSSVIMLVQISMRNALVRGKHLMESIFEGSPDSIFLVDPSNGRIETANQVAKRLFGMEDSRTASFNIGDCIPALRDKGTLEKAENQLAGGGDFHLESQFKVAEGEEVWGDVVIRRIRWGSGKRWLIRAADITEKKRADAQLSIAADILLNVPSLVVVTNLEGEVIYASPSIAPILGYSPEEVLGNRWWELTRPDPAEAAKERNRILEYVKNPGQSSQGGNEERRIVAKNGEIRYLSWMLSMTSGKNVIGIGTDVTDQRRERNVREVIYKVSRASVNVKSLAEFYQFIHTELIRSVNAYNIYIALQNSDDDDMITFPYYADQQYSEDYRPVARKRPKGNGLTEYVMRTREGHLFTGQDLIRLRESGEIQISGDIPKIWMGVPLVHDDKVVGVIATQDYANGDSFSASDLNLLSFVSGQIAHVITKLQADETLKRSQERYRAITEAAFEGAAVMRNGRIEEANEGFSKLFGYAEDEMVDMAWTDFLKAENAMEVMRRFAEGNGTRIDFVGKTKTGEERFLEGIGLEEFREHESGTVLLAVRDISEKKKMEEQEQAAKLDARFRSYVQHSSEIIAILNRDLTVQYVSPATKRVLGVEPEEIIGRDWFSTIHREEVESVREQVYEMINSGSGRLEVEYRRRHKDGGWRNLLTVITNLLNDPMVGGLLVSSRDITDRLAAEDELRKTASTIEATFQSTKDAILVVDSHGNCLSYNAQFLSLWEMPEAVNNDAKGRVEWVLSKVKDRDYFDSRLRDLVNLVRTEDNFYTELINGKIVEVYVRPLYQGKTVTGRLWFFHDITEIKRAQEELASYLGLLETTFDLSTDGVLVVDKDNRVLNYNRLFLMMWDFDEMDFVKASVEEKVQMAADKSRNPEELVQKFSEVQLNPQMETFDVIELQNGNILERYSKPLAIHGDVTGRVWFYRDVTERIRTARAIQENEAKYRSLFSQANDAIFLMDKELLLECNEKTFEMFACTAEDILGKTLSAFSPELQPDGDLSQLRLSGYIHAALEAKPQFFGWKFLRKDGKPFDAEVSLNAIMIGEDRFIQAMVRDISEQVVTGLALRSSERRNKAILDAIPDMMFRVNGDGQFLDFKAGMKGELGIEGGGVLDAAIFDIFPQEIGEKVFEMMTLAANSGDIQAFEFEFQEIPGQIQDYEARIVASGQGEWLIMLRNVTERKRTEKELIKRNFELDSFVYRASHDLKAPLTSLMGLIRIAKTDTDIERMPMYFGMMDKSVSKLDTFIKDLTDFSRNARLETQWVEIDFRETIYELSENLRFMENADRVKTELEINQTEPFFSDPLRIGIIFNNLISNGVKYFDTKKADPWVKIIIDVNEEGARIKIQDNGIGIGKEHMPRIFDLFYRATAESFGSGLGLYIVKNAVEKLRGNIRAESEIGEGTTFLIFLPKSDSPIQD